MKDAVEEVLEEEEEEEANLTTECHESLYMERFMYHAEIASCVVRVLSAQSDPRENQFACYDRKRSEETKGAKA